AKTLKEAQQQVAKAKPKKSKQPTTLYPFLGAERQTDASGIAYSLVDYFGLIDWTGRVIRSDKKGAIPPHIQPLLEKLSINEEAWLHGVRDFGQSYGCAVGSQTALKRYGLRLEKNGLQGVKASQRFYRAA
ncbi:MAG: alpha-amylase family glycosyl hydrolase, partial [Thiohalomonadales bacterium]